LIDDGTRACRTLLTLVAISGLHYARDSAVDVGFAVDNDGVLAAHFCHHPLDPDLPLAGFCGELVDAQTDVARSGERDEARLGMLDQKIAHDGSAARAQVV